MTAPITDHVARLQRELAVELAKFKGDSKEAISERIRLKVEFLAKLHGESLAEIIDA